MPDSHAPRNPFEGVTDLFTELSRMRDVGTHGREPAHEDRQRTHASAWVPTTDIFAQGDGLVIRVELAGVDPADIDLRFANGVLTVSGDRSPEFGDDADEPTFYVRERFYGEFRRSITLPEGTRGARSRPRSTTASSRSSSPAPSSRPIRPASSCATGRRVRPVAHSAENGWRLALP